METDTAARAAGSGRRSPDLGIVDGLVQLSTIVQAVLGRVAAGSDLSLSQARLLGVLRDREPAMAQLARLLDLDKSSTTGLVDRAERRGLVRRVEVPEDGRAFRVVLTAAGRQLSAVLGAEVTRQINALTDDLSATNRKRLSLLASRIVLRDAAVHGVDVSTPTSPPQLAPPPNATLPGTVAAEQRQATGRVAVVIGSTRPARICPGIAEWVLAAAQQDSPLRYELVDLAEVHLPLLDEPLMAAFGRYEHDHTRAWSRTVSSFDGFIFVFPQYNWGYPAPLKNALDYLFVEWNEKPTSYLTYGTRGGNRAAEQFHGVLGGLHMRELANHVEAVITPDDVDATWQLRDLESTLRPYLAQMRLIDAQMVEALKESN